MKPSAPIHRLKRKARLLSREEHIPLHDALDRVALQEGYASWSLLAVKRTSTPQASNLFQRLSPGDLVLIGARPGQGKTLMGLKLAVAAMRSGQRSAFFTLEYTANDVLDRLRAIGAEPA
jgi:replicative DNA helicase